MSRRISRLCAIALTAVCLFTAPAAFAGGFGDVALELPDLASLWDRVASLWSGDVAADEVIQDEELAAKHGGHFDPLGDEGAGGGDTTQQSSPADVPLTASPAAFGSPSP